MNLLSIGNSFSQDAQRYIHQIAKANGDDIYCANLYIGGCSLERHYNNIVNDSNEYDYQINGNDKDVTKSSIKQALLCKKWDVITIQQVSSFSGIIEKYYPFITEVIKYVKEFCPNAEIILHQTWSYENGSDHGDFKYYNHDSDEMFRRIVETNKQVAIKENIKTVFKCGELINKLRNLPEFDYQNGGVSLCRDTFHMSYDLGRFALSLLWYRTLTNKPTSNIDFIPPFETERENNLALTQIIKHTVDEMNI